MGRARDLSLKNGAFSASSVRSAFRRFARSAPMAPNRLPILIVSTIAS